VTISDTTGSRYGRSVLAAMVVASTLLVAAATPKSVPGVPSVPVAVERAEAVRSAAVIVRTVDHLRRATVAQAGLLSECYR
jgi:hypothetical protein